MNFVPPEDFFDEDWEEPKTQDTAVTRPKDGAPPPGRDTAGGGEPPPPRKSRPTLRTPGRGGGGRGGGSGQSLEYGRLALLAGAIVVVLLLGWALVSWTTGGSSISASQKYFNSLQPVIRSSNAVGQNFHALTLSRAVPVAKFKSELNAQLTRSQQAVADAAAIKPSKQLAPVQPFLLQALQYRVNGLRCLLANADAAYAKHSEVVGGAPMALCTKKLLASDVVYADSFSGASTAILKGDKTVAQPPTSQFLNPNDTDLVLATGWGAVLTRLKGQVTGIHGTGVGMIVAQPGNTVLKGAGPTQVKESVDLKFVVTVINKGNSQEVQIPVHFTLTHPGATPIEKTATIASVNAHQKVQVTFGQIFDSSHQPLYNQPYSLTIKVDKVPGEVRLDNNHRTTKVTLLASS